MSPLQSRSEKEKTDAITVFINLFSLKSVSILFIWVWVGFLIGCSAEGSINGPTINAEGVGIFNQGIMEWVAPEEAGWSSAELQHAHEFAVQSRCDAVMALYDGKVFFSRGNIHQNYGVHSIREHLKMLL